MGRIKKREVKQMTEKDIDCDTCKYHSYDWYTEGPNAYDEFEVCLKGNFLHDGECKDYEIFEDYIED